MSWSWLGWVSYAGLTYGLMWAGSRVVEGALWLWMNGWLPLHLLPDRIWTS